MGSTDLIVILSLITMLAVLAFAMVSKWRTERLMNDDSAPKSTLAADAPDSH